MTRMSKSVTLVLAGSSLVLAGYLAWRAWADRDEDREAGAAGGRGSGGSHGHAYVGSSRSRPFAAPARPSARSSPSGSRPGGSASVHSGGFGSTGHAVGS